MPIYTSEQMEELSKKKEHQTDWEKVDALAELNKDLPDDDFDWDNAVLLTPHKTKKQISFRVENDLLEWLKKEAHDKKMRGYQSLMHSILETYRQAQNTKAKTLSSKE